MTRTILHISNQGFRLIELLENSFNDMHVRPFIITTNIVNFSIAPLMNNEVNCATMIFNIQPVTNVQAISVYWELPICQGF
ncbi:hypothetical protein D3C71_1988930 [compost metagenome]